MQAVRRAPWQSGSAATSIAEAKGPGERLTIEPLERYSARLGGIVAGPGAEWEYAGVDLEENKALVRRYYQEVLTGRDRELLARLLDSCFVSHGSGGSAAGAGAYTAAVAATHAAFPTWW